MLGENVTVDLTTNRVLTEADGSLTPLGLVVCEHIDKIPLFEPGVVVRGKEVRGTAVRFALTLPPGFAKPFALLVKGYKIGCFKIAREYRLLRKEENLPIFADGFAVRSDAMRVPFEAAETILFDLDGTLTDPSLGITNSVMHALAKRGIVVEDRASLHPFIGPPLVESFRRFYGFTDEEAHRAVADYREYFADQGIFENAVLPGAEDLLRGLRAEGRRVLVATSKPEPFAVRIVEHFGLAPLIDGVFGATFDQSRSRKADVIAHALARTPAHGPSLMVGDRLHDVEGARENGLDAVGVLCGFGDERELREAGAGALATSLPALARAFAQPSSLFAIISSSNV